MSALASQPQASPMPPSIWRNRTFVLIWLGNAISVIGDGFHSVALGLWVLQTTGSATAMGGVMAARIIVGVLLGAVAGTVADRTDRRRLMIAMNLVRTVLVLGVAYIVASGHGGLPAVVGLTALIAVFSSFFGPAFGASLSNIVGKEHVGQASSLLQLTNTLAQVVGPMLAGVVVGLAGGALALCVDSASFLVGGMAIWLGGRFPSPQRAAQDRTSFWHDLTAGFDYIKQQPLIRALLTVAPLLNFFANAAFVLLPVIAVKAWLVNSQQYGLLEALFPLGFAAGAALVMARMKSFRRRGYWMCGGFISTGILTTAIMAMPRFVPATPLIFVVGGAYAIINVLAQATFQEEVAEEVKGRVFGMINSLATMTNPAAMLLGGLLSDVFTPVQVGVAFGLLSAAAGLAITVLFSALREYR